MLIDTDVLIWLFRGHIKAKTSIEKCKTIELSAITYMELVQGMRNKDELNGLRQTMHEQNWQILPLNENISHHAMIYIENYGLSHGLELADALIAATAAESGLPLMTANAKHYKIIPDIKLVQYRP